MCRGKRQFFINKDGSNSWQRIFIVKHYFRNESYVLCQKAYQEAFPNDTVPKMEEMFENI
jgi:hypothetical protein